MSHATLPTYLEVPRYEDYQVSEHPTRILYPEVVLPWARSLIKRALRDHPQVVFSLDGPSGSGKTTFCEQVEDYFRNTNDGTRVVRLEQDRFLGTLVGSTDRRQMLEGPENFWDKVNDWETIKEVLTDIRKLGERGGTVNLAKTYQRDHFDYDQPLIIPEGKKVIVVAGLKSTDSVDEVYPSSERIKGLVYTPGRISLVAALIRDIERGRVQTVEELMFRAWQRKQEAQFQLPKFAEMMTRPDVAIIDNSEQFPDYHTLVTRYRELVYDLVESDKKRDGEAGDLGVFVSDPEVKIQGSTSVVSFPGGKDGENDNLKPGPDMNAG